MKLTAFFGLSLIVCAILVACGSTREPAPQPAKSVSPTAPSSLWGQRAEAADWNATVLSALGAHGAPLLGIVPADIDTYCPTYREAGPEGRKVFWLSFLSALAKHESTWRPDAAGGGGAWLGQLQISPQTARGYGCKAQSAAALKNGSQNLSCGIRIMARTVARDGVISAGMGGVAADWGPFHSPAKRADIQRQTLSTPVCRG